MSKHTEGPWRVGLDYGIGVGPDDDFLMVAARPKIMAALVAAMSGELPEAIALMEEAESPEYEANARLIAAAPDLLDFAQMVKERADAQRRSGDRYITLSFGQDYETLCAAIAKAKGDS